MWDSYNTDSLKAHNKSAVVLEIICVYLKEHVCFTTGGAFLRVDSNETDLEYEKDNQTDLLGLVMTSKHPKQSSFLFHRKMSLCHSQLFQFLASVIESAVTPEGKIFLATKEERVVSTSTLDISALQPCTQEEADHHIMLHCAHAHQHGMHE